ncbi:MAG: 4-hydroxy-tetrahydrodipicolinate reductase, partial [Candidatus Daviesbacteria bacterium]|nr:4-hydroxy-tetrahydrodipicolinate reductase [Candidatus Daviesbacteria bacterium]
MKIALIGFGNMGKEISNLINELGTHQVVSVSYKTTSDSLDKEGIVKADVVIDFTSPEIVANTIKEVAGMGKNMVVGTTGWYDQLDQVREMVEKSKTGLIYAQNFSIGANIFFQIVGFASSLFNR